MITMKVEDYVGRADDLIRLAEDALTRLRPGAMGGSIVESDAFMQLRSAALSFIERVFGRDHSYFVEFDAKVKDVSDYYVRYAIGILKAVRSELAGGWFVTTRGLISSEVFADFLDMSEYLLAEGYKDPAAVMTGGVLEEHLRQLATKAGIPVTQVMKGKDVHRKADSLNADLVKTGVYGVLDQKTIIGWLDLRNKAAHGKYAEYTHDQVNLMLAGTRNFVARFPL
jgi:hypothetical protein